MVRRRGLVALLPLLAAAPLGATELYLLNYAPSSVLGQQGNRDVRTSRFAASDDGRYALFVTLHAPDGFTSGTPRVFLHDADTGQLTQINVSPHGAQLDAPTRQRVGLSRTAATRR
ncbi:MAG TPA: hypothetical protein VLF18_08715 [Tahibacter sp.]|uniref:hypothetical protein n=1 Tax=Tahibacter sp. TaxID=2056211 RepID=UPI002BA4B4CC|nr:hypothetical protein [Tahibacter sp.]HSX60266.1 hypothetical protein [Tahibacter sp.]